MMPMADLDARPVDPRDHRWEVWDPAFRVYFWRPIGGGAWGSRELQVSANDVTETIEWADLNARDGETYTLFAVVDRGNDAGLVRLAGHDPTRNERT
jgi:hypothetical protein